MTLQAVSGCRFCETSSATCTSISVSPASAPRKGGLCSAAVHGTKQESVAELPATCARDMGRGLTRTC